MLVCFEVEWLYKFQQRPEDETGSLELGVTGDSMLLKTGYRNQAYILWKSNTDLNL